ncbi:MAG: biotin/lipoyl-binding protein [Rubrivivax sp.]
MSAALSSGTRSAAVAPLHAGREQATPLVSEQWFRVSALRPCLADGVRADRVVYRGQPWIVLASADGRRRVRLNQAAWALVGRCDGLRPMQQLWEILLRERQDDAPTQDELIVQLMLLYRDGYLRFDEEPDFGAMAALESGAPQQKKPGLGSLLAIRVPLGSPERALARLEPLGRAVFSSTGLALWLLLVAAGAVAAFSQAGAVADFAGKWLRTPHVVVLTWVMFPLMKLLHEGAHALAVRRFGGRVPEWGVTVMVLTPVPYVDASAADGFGPARQRLVVSAAGAMVELALAAVAALALTVLQPGLARDLAMLVFVLGALSSLVVNANPLLRFDGYHALTDLLQLPNLATRSSRHWLQRLGTLVGLPAAQEVPPSPGERAWWWAYAPASLVCRVLLSVGLVMWLGGQNFWLGMVVLALLLGSMAVLPLLRAVRHLWGLQLEPGQARRGRARAGLALAAVLGVLVALPLPDVSVARGILWLPDDGLVRAGTAGFVQEVLVQDGQLVQAGEPIARLSNPTLETEQADIDGRIVGLWVELHQALGEDPAKAQRVARQLEAAEAARVRVDQRVNDLVLRAPAAGRVGLTRPQDLPGRFLAQGTVLAHLVPVAGVRTVASAGDDELPAPAAPLNVRVALEAEEAASMEVTSASISVHVDGPHPQVLAARLVRDSLAATRELPSPALGDRFGGPIVTDPADTQGRMAARDVVVLALEVPGLEGGARTPIGQRVWVRFDRGNRPLAFTVARSLQQAVLVHFSPAR